MADNLYEKQVFGLTVKVIPAGDFISEETGVKVEYGRSIKLVTGNRHFRLEALQAIGLREILTDPEFTQVIKPWAVEEKASRQSENDLLKHL